MRRRLLATFLPVLLRAQCPPPQPVSSPIAPVTLQHPRPIAGAIRWDAWHGKQGTPGRAVEASLSPEKWRYRLPFFARIDSPDHFTLDGASQPVMDREIAYASAAGLDYWAFVTYDENDPMSLGLKNYLASSHRRDIHFSLIVEYPRLGRPGAYLPQLQRLVRLMTQPTYQRVLDNRPLLYLGFFPDNLLKEWGGPDRFRRYLEELRQAARSAGAGNPYIVFMGSDPIRTNALRELVGADALSAYATQAGESAAPYANLAAASEKFWSRCQATGADVVPIVMSGWDRRPRVERPVPWEHQQPNAGLDHYYRTATPAAIANHLATALTWIDANPKSAPARAALIYAWNENDEGGWLVPTLCEGASRLDAIGRILAPSQPKTRHDKR